MQFDWEAIRSLVFGLDEGIGYAGTVLGELEGHQFDLDHNQADPYFDDERKLDELADIMEELHDRIAVAFDALGLVLSREQFLERWIGHRADLKNPTYSHEHDCLISEPYQFLQQAIRTLRMIAVGGESPTSEFLRGRLEFMLESTAVLLRKRGVTPVGEACIQGVMDDYLSAAFVDYVQHPSIPGHLKHFKPDGGIRAIGAAIEYKFVRSESELKIALSGIMEDIAGYSGSRDWTRFYSVIYMTEPFAARARFQEDLKRASADTWTAVLVNREAPAPKKKVTVKRPRKKASQRTTKKK